MAGDPTPRSQAPRRGRRWVLLAMAAALVGLAVAGGLVLRKHWVRIGLAFVPDMYALPVDAGGYRIERLPMGFVASFACGHDVYLATRDGRVYKGDDRDTRGEFRQIGQAAVSPKMLFVTSKGTLLLSNAGTPPVMRSADGGKTWEKCLDSAFWRADEDEATGTLYAGAYTPKKDAVFHAIVYKSTNDGATWQKVFDEPDQDHVHTLRYDARQKRLYIAVGDQPARRGQAWSDDGGATWHWLHTGPKEGHTDLAFTDHHVLWGSDDQMGRLLLAPRDPVADGKARLWATRQDIWFVVAEGGQVYVGTFAMRNGDDPGAFLLASSDEGTTWQKLMYFHQAGDEARGQSAFYGECRRLSADGWLYFSTTDRQGYRVRNMKDRKTMSAEGE